MDTLSRIESLIKNMGWSKSEFLRRLGISVNSFTEWKAGRNQSYMKHLPKIAELLGTTEDYLLCKTDDPASDKVPRDLEALEIYLKREGIIPKDKPLTKERADWMLSILRAAAKNDKGE